jgi:DNA repair protein RecN (Recombination protein N)
MRSLVGHVSDIAVLDPKSAGLAERATELLVLTEDLARDLRDYADSVEADEERLAEIEDRLALIQTLKRKYGATVSEVIAFGDQAKSDLEKLTSTELDIEALREREALLAKDLSRRAMILSLRRREAATALANAVERSIRDLRLGSSHIAIDLSARADPDGVEIDTPNGTERVHVDETGIDVIEYLFAPNTGESLKPLARIASGGEMARLMLAIKSILSEVDLTPTLVFDEIDVGVGGRSGQVVGEKLWGISTRHQVIVVSHLSQVAAYAAHHLRIEKQESSGRTVSTVRVLDDEERARELATMLDGLPVSDASLASAREIMARASAFIERSTAVRA